MKLASGLVALALLIAGAVWWVSSVEPEAPVTIENPRVRLVPGGGPMAGYMEIHNHSDQAIRLVGARSEHFGRVMIHRSIVADGRTRMQHQPDGLEIRAGQSALFKPRDLHLMLMQPTISPEIGDQLEIVLRFEGSQAVPAAVPVMFTVVPITSS
ncbi:MAG: copper chaperone PCu(A)C [Wenzhouxiangellaceae bacterium]|nr:copper chaperone PCu(A)C [Wenzhouxiangellaceae bacterium]